MPRFEVMIGSKGVKKYEAPNKAAAYKLAVKDNCKEGDVNFMKMTEAVITKEILPIFKSFDFEGYEYVALTLMLFYIANNDPDIKEGDYDMAVDIITDEMVDKPLDDILNVFFVKNKTKAIAKFKKNMFTMLRSGVFYLRFLNDPQVLFCNKEEVVKGVVDLVSNEYQGGGEAWVRDKSLEPIDRLKQKNGSILPILSYDRKKIASDEEYKKKFLNLYYTFAYQAKYTKSKEAEEVYLTITDPVEEEAVEGQDQDDTRTQKEKREQIRIDKEELARMRGYEPTVKNTTVLGKDFWVRLVDNVLYQEDEDGQYENFGIRLEKTFKDKNFPKRKKTLKVWIREPTDEERKEARRQAQEQYKKEIEEENKEIDEFLESGRNIFEEEYKEDEEQQKQDDRTLEAKIRELEERIYEYANQDTDRETDLNSEKFTEEGKEILKDEIETRGFTFTLEDVEELPNDQQLAIYDLSQLLYIASDLSIDGDFAGGRILIGTAFRNIVLPIAEQFIILQGEATNDEERMEKIRRLEERIKELETQLLEQINSKPVEVAEEPKSDFADVSKLLQEIADLTEAREKERGEIVKVQKLEVQVESLNRMIDNLVEERDEYAVSVVELEEALKGAEESPSKEVEDDEETDEDLQDNFDALESILKSLGVDVDDLLEAIKEEDDIFEFYETPAYANLVLRPIAEELDSKEFDREDDEDD